MFLPNLALDLNTTNQEPEWSPITIVIIEVSYSSILLSSEDMAVSILGYSDVIWECFTQPCQLGITILTLCAMKLSSCYFKDGIQWHWHLVQFRSIEWQVTQAWLMLWIMSSKWLMLWIRSAKWLAYRLAVIDRVIWHEFSGNVMLYNCDMFEKASWLTSL